MALSGFLRGFIIRLCLAVFARPWCLMLGCDFVSLTIQFILIWPCIGMLLKFGRFIIGGHPCLKTFLRNLIEFLMRILNEFLLFLNFTEIRELDNWILPTRSCAARKIFVCFYILLLFFLSFLCFLCAGMHVCGYCCILVTLVVGSCIRKHITFLFSNFGLLLFSFELTVSQQCWFIGLTCFCWLGCMEISWNKLASSN